MTSASYSSDGRSCGRGMRNVPSSVMIARVAVATASALDWVRPTMLIMTWPPPVSGPPSGRYGSSPVTWPVTPDAAKARTASSSRLSGTGFAWLSNASALPYNVLPSANCRLRRVMKVSMSEWRANSA